MSEAWRGGSTRQWRKVRAFVLSRDRYSCQARLAGCTGRATEAHHLDGKAAGDDPARIIATCRHCNLKIGDPTRPRGRAGPVPVPQVRPVQATLW